MTIRIDVEGMPEIAWEDLWPRRARFGDAVAYLGADVVIVISRVFTTDEDQVLRWLVDQDSCDLFGIQHLPDGRDLMVFNRLYDTQTRESAEEEHRLHLRQLIRRLEAQRPLFPGQRNMTQRHAETAINATH